MTQQAQQTFITAEIHRWLLTPQLFDAIAGLSFADGRFEELPLITRYSSVDFLRTTSTARSYHATCSPSPRAYCATAGSTTNGCSHRPSTGTSSTA